jgi:hypothetical protein
MRGDMTTIYVPYAAVSITGTIQPSTLRRALLPEFFENGLAARLLVTMPPQRAKRWTEYEVPDDIAADVEKLFNRLFSLRPAQQIGGGEEPMLVDLSDTARGEWAAFVDRHNEDIQNLEGPARAAGAKLEGYAARFTLLLHCIQQATGEKLSEYVEVGDVEAASSWPTGSAARPAASTARCTRATRRATAGSCASGSPRRRPRHAARTAAKVPPLSG